MTSNERMEINNMSIATGMSKEQIQSNQVKIAMAQMCLVCMMSSSRDLSTAECAPGWIYCRYWNELKYGKSICPNFVGGK
jgi:hypothetical protein